MKILIIDDDEVDRMRLRRLIRDCRNLRVRQVDEATDKASGFQALLTDTYDLVLLDFHLPDGDGLSFLQELPVRGIAAPPIIVQTVLDDEATGLLALEAGAQDYLIKGNFTSKDLTHSIRYASERQKLLQKNMDLVAELKKVVVELKSALSQVKALSGLLPICSSCKKIRNDKGYWEQIESYIGEHSEAEFSHSICPDCVQQLYPGLLEKKKRNNPV